MGFASKQHESISQTIVYQSARLCTVICDRLEITVLEQRKIQSQPG